MSPIVAFSPDEAFGREILDRLTADELAALSSFPDCDFSTVNPAVRALVGTVAAAIASAKAGGFIAADTEDGYFRRGDLARVPRAFHPELVTQRVRIPTVHIVGGRDSAVLVKLSRLMKQLCDGRVVRSLVHAGGHDVPKKPEDVKAAVAALEWAIEQSQRQVW